MHPDALAHRGVFMICAFIPRREIHAPQAQFMTGASQAVRKKLPPGGSWLRRRRRLREIGDMFDAVLHR